jgi:hypothetical protein
MTKQKTDPPRLVADGTEGIEGRALLVLSALHHCMPWLQGWEVALVGAEPAVLAASEALYWDTGLAISPTDDAASVLAGSRLYVAVTCRTTDHLPCALLATLRVPCLIAVQFPDPMLHGAAEFALQRAAHDPVLLARLVRERIGAT